MIDSCSLGLLEPESVECQTGTLGEKLCEHIAKWPSKVRRKEHAPRYDPVIIICKGVAGTRDNHMMWIPITVC